jgi:hypothetical protein
LLTLLPRLTSNWDPSILPLLYQVSMPPCQVILLCQFLLFFNYVNFLKDHPKNTFQWEWGSMW